ncbi:MAG: hypothetical protein AAF170_04290 [Bacteroidota bacterium]
MASKDLTHTILAAIGFPAATVSADADGPTVDTQGFESVAFTGLIANADGTADLAITVEHSDDDSVFAAAPADDVHNETVEIGNSDADRAFQIGYRGSKRYVRLSVTRAAGSADVSAVAVLGHARIQPTY